MLQSLCPGSRWRYLLTAAACSESQVAVLRRWCYVERSEWSSAFVVASEIRNRSVPVAGPIDFDEVPNPDLRAIDDLLIRGNRRKCKCK